MRLFAAVDLDSAARRGAAVIAEGMTRQLSHGNSAHALRWVLPGQLHITLRFLGETSYEQVDSIRLALQLPWESEAFSVAFEGLNLFPLAGRPRVVCFGINRGQDQLAALKAELDRRLGSVGLAPSGRPFLAHLNFGADWAGARRVRVRCSKASVRLPAAFGPMACRSFHFV